MHAAAKLAGDLGQVADARRKVPLLDIRIEILVPATADRRKPIAEMGNAFRPPEVAGISFRPVRFARGLEGARLVLGTEERVVATTRSSVPRTSRAPSRPRAKRTGRKDMPATSGGRKAFPISAIGLRRSAVAGTRISMRMSSKGTFRRASATWPRSPASLAAACISIPRPSVLSTIPRPTSSSNASITVSRTKCRVKSSDADATNDLRWSQVLRICQAFCRSA